MISCLTLVRNAMLLAKFPNHPEQITHLYSLETFSLEPGSRVRSQPGAGAQTLGTFEIGLQLWPAAAGRRTPARPGREFQFGLQGRR